MEFIEAPIFTKYVENYLAHEEYNALQLELLFYPEKGDLIPQTGGLRKMRWPAKGQGKRGGVRIIYYYKSKDNELWLLTIYAKNEEKNLPLKDLKRLKKEIMS